MRSTLALPNNSTTVRSGSMVPRSLVRAYFAVASRIVPDIARRHAEDLFTRPPRYTGRSRALVDARRETVVAGRHSLAVWQAGPPSADAVLLAHGWGGRGAQMTSFVAPLAERGYRVVWFDQPGHGDSTGRRVALPDFVRALQAISTTHGPFVAAIGHSLGAAAIGVALRRGLALGRVAFIGSPSSINQHAHRFARLLGLTPAIRDAMRNGLERRYGVRFDDIDRIEELRHVRAPTLFVHDRYDPEVPHAHAAALSSHLPDSTLITTYGFGHYRLLREPGVVRAVVDFVSGDADSLPAELPRLPRPAPLY